MQFTYVNDIPTVEQAMRQVVLAWSGSPDQNPLVKTFLIRKIEESVIAGLAEVRHIMTAELTTLFDREAVAKDWNDAIEKAIQVVEGSA